MKVFWEEADPEVDGVAWVLSGNFHEIYTVPEKKVCWSIIGQLIFRVPNGQPQSGGSSPAEVREAA